MYFCLHLRFLKRMEIGSLRHFQYQNFIIIGIIKKKMIDSSKLDIQSSSLLFLGNLSYHQSSSVYDLFLVKRMKISPSLIFSPHFIRFSKLTCYSILRIGDDFLEPIRNLNFKEIANLETKKRDTRKNRLKS